MLPFAAIATIDTHILYRSSMKPLRSSPLFPTGVLLAVLAVGYAVSLLAMLMLGMSPGVPWRFVVSASVFDVPIAAMVVSQISRADSARPASPARCLLWGIFVPFVFQWTNPVFRVAVLVTIPFVVQAAWRLSREDKTRVVLIGLAIIAGYGMIWNLNYLAMWHVGTALKDSELLASDISIYRWLFGIEPGHGLYPLLKHPQAVEIFERSYGFLFSEVFIVLLASSDRRRIEFLSTAFGCYLLAVLWFWFYPSLGPIIFADFFHETFRNTTTWRFMNIAQRVWLFRGIAQHACCDGLADANLPQGESSVVLGTSANQCPDGRQHDLPWLALYGGCGRGRSSCRSGLLRPADGKSVLAERQGCRPPPRSDGRSCPGYSWPAAGIALAEFRHE
jgi:hypothetical protein